MKWLVVVLGFFAAGLGTGFYLWGMGDSTLMPQEVQKLVDKIPAQNPAREDVTTKPLSTSDITSGIVGKWQSTENQKFTRTFSVDASVVDAYEGEPAATVQGRWAVFTAPQGEPPPFPIKPGTIYLKISTVEEVLYFKVVQLTEEALELVYLEGGERSRFTRAQ